MLLMYKNTFIFFVDIKVQGKCHIYRIFFCTHKLIQQTQDDPNCISQSAHCLLTDGQWSV